jgi:hypothetical protein
MNDIPMPPWMRVIQQSYIWQFVCLPILLGFGSAILVGGCLSHGIDNIERECIMGAVSTTIVSLLTVIISGHSTNSASFHTDGTPNKLVEQVAEMTKPLTPPEVAEVKVDVKP